jgi:hemolysin activation/secretion protein
VVGDYGYAGSAELGWRSPTLWPAPLKGSELYGFVDGGRAWVRERLPYAAAASYSLASAGAGVRFLVRQKSSFGFEAAKAVDAPYPGQNKPWRVIISWHLAR